jgi:hypothetical protein
MFFNYPIVFVGALEQSWRPLLTSSCPSVCPHVSVRLALEGVTGYMLLLFVLVVGPISIAAVMAYCTLHPIGVPSFISRGAAHQAARERPLLAKDGTKAKEFS